MKNQPAPRRHRSHNDLLAKQTTTQTKWTIAGAISGLVASLGLGFLMWMMSVSPERKSADELALLTMMFVFSLLGLTVGGAVVGYFVGHEP